MTLIQMNLVLSFDLVNFEHKHFLTLILPSSRSKQFHKLLSSICTVLLIVATEEFLSYAQDDLRQLKGLNVMSY